VGSPAASDLLDIQNLKTYFDTPDGVVRAVDGVSFAIAPKETLGLVGESGCGKSVTAYSILRLLPLKTSRIVEGQIAFRRRDGQIVDLSQADPRGDLIRSIRGNEIAMIFQEPMTSLSPVHTVGSQIAEAVKLHQGVGKEEAERITIEALKQVGIANPEQRVLEYPHQFSGGMRQRAMIAMALSCNPSLLIADEPTTALDVTIQAQILELMKSLQERFEMSILIITHNLGVVADMADRVAVMYMGKIVETGPVRDIFHHPMHPYTVGLMQSVPKMGRNVKQRLIPIAGSVPDPFSIPRGCAFLPRCAAQKRLTCAGPADVALTEVGAARWVRCTLYQ
jgi:oligopeptide/dipeptide ABC transporter ATP-binding protein